MRALRLILPLALILAVGCSGRTAQRPSSTPKADPLSIEFKSRVLDIYLAGEDLLLLLDGQPNRTLARVDRDGKHLWEKPVQQSSIQRVSADGSTILLRDADFTAITVLNAEGEATGTFPYSFPQVSADGRLIVVAPELETTIQAFDGTGSLLWSHEVQSDAGATLASNTGDVLFWNMSDAGLLDRNGKLLWTWKAPEGTWVHGGQITPDGRYSLVTTANAPPPPHLEVFLASRPGVAVKYQAALLDHTGSPVGGTTEPGRLLPEGGLARWTDKAISIRTKTSGDPVTVSVPAGCASGDAEYRVERSWVLALCEVSGQVRGELRNLADERLWQGTWSQRPVVALNPGAGAIWVAEGQVLKRILISSMDPVGAP